MLYTVYRSYGQLWTSDCCMHAYVHVYNVDEKITKLSSNENNTRQLFG